MGCSVGAPRVALCKPAEERQTAGLFVIAPGLIKGENCVTSCAGFANVIVTAFRSKVAEVPDTAFRCVPCTMCSVANLRLQVLLTFVRTSYPLMATSLTYGPEARWKDSKTNMTSVWLEKGPRSCRADMPRNDEMMGRSCIR